MKQLSLTISATVLFAGALFAAPIHDAAREGDIVVIQAQLDAGADVNAEDGFLTLDTLRPSASRPTMDDSMASLHRRRRYRST